MSKRVITAKQETAIAALLSGQTVIDAAEAAGVSRRTVHSWLQSDFVFLASLNAERNELRRAARRRLEGLAADAVVCIGKAIQNGDTKVALELLRGLGVFSESPSDPEDPGQLQDEATAAKYEAAGRAAEAYQAAAEAQELAQSWEGPPAGAGTA